MSYIEKEIAHYRIWKKPLPIVLPLPQQEEDQRGHVQWGPLPHTEDTQHHLCYHECNLYETTVG